MIECNQNIIKLEIEIAYDSNKLEDMKDIIIKRNECKSELDNIKEKLSLYEIYKTLVDKKMYSIYFIKRKVKIY